MGKVSDGLSENGIEHRRMNFTRKLPITSKALVWLVLAVFAGIVQGGAWAQGEAFEAFSGQWQGAIDVAGTPLEIIVRLAQVDDVWEGTIDIPAQGAFEVPLTGIEIEGENIRFLMAGIPGDPTFHGSLAGDRIEGTFTQGGVTFPFAMTRSVQEGDSGELLLTPEDQYVDPLGRYSVPVPVGWRVTMPSRADEVDGDGDTGEAGEDWVVLTDPDEQIRLAIFVIPAAADEVDAAVREAWSRFDPQFDLEPYQVLEVPDDPRIERSLLYNYDGPENRIYQAAAILYEGQAYILLVDGELAAVQRRAAQVQIVATGLEITGLERIDLSGAPLKPVAEIEAALDAFIAESLDAFGIPGAAVAVVQDGEVVYLKGFGVKRAGGDEPVTPDTHMMIGSVGKTMTTMLMAALVDEGLFDWETPVVSVLPQFAVADPGITEKMAMRHLVCACTGVPRRDLELLFNADELSAEAIVASLRTFEFFTGFGEAFQYSNQLVATAGYAAAAADGAAFGELFEGYAASLERRVLKPIGMNDTTLSIDQVLGRGDYALPHALKITTGEYVPLDVHSERLLTPVGPAGSHWSTARDLAQYLLTQLKDGVAPDGQRVVSEENLHTTWEPQVPISATESYGLGWMTGEYKGVRVVYHGGNTLGFTSELAFMPEAGLGVVVLANAEKANTFTVGVRTRLFELVYGVESEVEKGLEFTLAQMQDTIQELQSLLVQQDDPTDLEPFVGRYTNDALGDVVLALENGRLMMDAGEFRAEVRGVLDREGRPDGYVVIDAPVAGLPVALEHDEQGEPVVRLGSGAISYLLERVE